MNAEPVYTPLPRDVRFELRLWMFEYGVSVKRLAIDFDVGEMTVSRWRTVGGAKPSRSHALKLERATAGRITAAMWDAA